MLLPAFVQVEKDRHLLIPQPDHGPDSGVVLDVVLETPDEGVRDSGDLRFRRLRPPVGIHVRIGLQRELSHERGEAPWPAALEQSARMLLFLRSGKLEFVDMAGELSGIGIPDKAEEGKTLPETHDEPR
jgi:hypothetical protein